jgi:hypothetical protein
MRTPQVARLVGLVALVVVSPVLAAQQPGEQSTEEAAPQPHRTPFVFGLSATSMAITPTTAGSASVHNQAWGLQLDGGLVLRRLLYVGVDIGPQMLADHASFTQTTTAGDRKSTASAVYFSALAGPRTPSFHVPGFGSAAVGLFGGASTTVAKRSIDNCVDCTVNDLSIPGGAFVQPTLLLGEGGVRMRIAQRQFLTGDGIRYVASAGMELGGGR